MSAPAHYRLMQSILVALVLLDALLLTSFVLNQWFEVSFWEAVGLSALLSMPLTMLAMPLVDAVLAESDRGKITGFSGGKIPGVGRSEEHTSELQSLMRISYAVYCLKQKP